MGILNIKLKGASIIEAIVASVIFLIVFAISLDTVSRILPGSDSSESVLIEADYRCDMAFAMYSGGEYPPGTYEEGYGWGKVTVVIATYSEDYPGLYRLTISAEPVAGKRKIEFNHIIHAADGQEQ